MYFYLIFLFLKKDISKNIFLECASINFEYISKNSIYLILNLLAV